MLVFRLFPISLDPGTKSSPDSGHPNDADSSGPDNSKGFYENLPFHGMQQQQAQHPNSQTPHKQVCMRLFF